MREPSIHISESILISILSDMKGETITNPTQYAKYILKKAKKHSLKHRSIQPTTQKIKNKVNKIVTTETIDITEMGLIIQMCRRKLKHTGVELIRPGTKDYTILNTITKNAKDFYSEYYGKTEKTKAAFIKYIEIGLTRMQKFSLPKLASLHETICSIFEATNEINTDPNPDITTRALQLYNKKVVDQVGSLFSDYRTMPEKYVYFVRVSALCRKLNISPETYIEAQFDGMEWFKGIPDPIQLVGNKSTEYLQKYLYKNPEKTVAKKNNTDYINKLKEAISGSTND